MTKNIRVTYEYANGNVDEFNIVSEDMKAVKHEYLAATKANHDDWSIFINEEGREVHVRNSAIIKIEIEEIPVDIE